MSYDVWVNVMNSFERSRIPSPSRCCCGRRRHSRRRHRHGKRHGRGNPKPFFDNLVRVMYKWVMDDNFYLLSSYFSYIVTADVTL